MPVKYLARPALFIWSSSHDQDQRSVPFPRSSAASRSPQRSRFVCWVDHIEKSLPVAVSSAGARGRVGGAGEGDAAAAEPWWQYSRWQPGLGLRGRGTSGCWDLELLLRATRPKSWFRGGSWPLALATLCEESSVGKLDFNFLITGSLCDSFSSGPAV